MALRLEAGWDFARVNTHKMLVTESTGSLAFQIVCDSNGVQHATSAGGSLVVSDSDTAWAHTDLTSVMGTGSYDDFAGALETALTAGSAANGNTWTYAVSYSEGAYTISASAAGTPQSIALGFSTLSDDGTSMRQLLGFSGDQASATSHTSDVRTYYTIVTAQGAKSQVREDEHLPGAISGAVSMGGQHYAIGPTEFVTLHDFTCMFESKAATFKRSAAANPPWTYQHLFEHAQAIEPILVVDSGASESTVHTMRPEGAYWHSLRAQPDWDMFHIEFLTYVDGRL